MSRRTLIIGDNQIIMEKVYDLITFHDHLHIDDFVFTSSPESSIFIENKRIDTVKINDDVDELAVRFGLIISIHSKQIFSPEVISKIRCINVHPGYNPYNRGWFPHVFSIINGAPCGVTIHEMDEKLDHGPIICQEQVPMEVYDTSESLYDRLITTEIKLLAGWFPRLISGDYSTKEVSGGNINSKKDYTELCEIDLNHIGSFEEHLNLLRSMSHGEYKNAYFQKSDKKVYVKVILEHMKENE